MIFFLHCYVRREYTLDNQRDGKRSLKLSRLPFFDHILCEIPFKEVPIRYEPIQLGLAGALYGMKYYP